jgi:hypothetical protein
MTTQESTQISEKSVSKKYEGTGDWAALTKSPETPLFSASEKLRLSPSALSSYYRCPRQFYYSSVLRLSSESGPQAQLGILVHRVMEAFNKGFAAGEFATYSLENLLNILDSLFSPDWNPAEKTLPELESLTQMARLELYNKLRQSFEDMAQKGYFNRSVQTVEAEKSIQINTEQNPVTMLGLEQCELVAKLDALIQDDNGQWDILDYKYYGPNRYKGKTPSDGKMAESLLHALTPLDSDAKSHSERFKSTESKPRDPQLPFYYWLSQQDEALKGKVRQVSLQLIRPPFPDNPAQGAIALTLDPSRIEEGLAGWIADLKKYVVEPSLSASVFQAVPNKQTCGSCSYSAVCDARSDVSEADANE